MFWKIRLKGNNRKTPVHIFVDWENVKGVVPPHGRFSADFWYERLSSIVGSDTYPDMRVSIYMPKYTRHFPVWEKQKKFLTEIRNHKNMRAVLGYQLYDHYRLREKLVDTTLVRDVVELAITSKTKLVVIIVSGDGDMYPAVETAKKYGHRVITASSSYSTSNLVKKESDLHVRLELP